MGGAANDGDWINTVEPLAGLADFNLTSDHSVHTSHSRSLCGVRCETHVTDVMGEDYIYMVGDIIF